MIKHHVSDETLLRYASGLLEPGPRVVVAVHIGGCRVCMERLAEFEAVGGSLLDEIEPAAIEADALEQVMARIDGDVPAPDHATLRPPPARANLGIRLPDALDGCGIGPWRWIGPGVRWSRVTVPGDDRSTVMLLKVAAGRRLPEHTHTGSEYTQVLSGWFSDSRGWYGPGDMDEADDEIQHKPIVDDGGECICLAALDGRMRLRGPIGRLTQSLLGG